MRWIFALCVAARALAGSFDDIEPSTPEEIASLTSNLLIERYVSAISGQISISDIDLHVRGAQDLILKRIYIPPLVLGRYHKKNSIDRGELGEALLKLKVAGWLVLPHLCAGYNKHSPYFQVRDSNGLVLEFQIQGNRGVLKTSSYGCTNLRGEEPSSAYDIRNTELWVDADEAKVLWPNGIQYHYSKGLFGFYYIKSELLPNGKVIRYAYDQPDGNVHISSADIQGKYTYATIDRLHEPCYRGSDGREVQFFYESRPLQGKIKYKDKNKKPQIVFYSTLLYASNPTYTHTMRYNERALLTSYDAKDYPISWTYWQQKDSLCRIQNFSTPSGTTTLSYDSPIPGQKSGSTTVVYPDGTMTIYRFNQLLLLEALENWLGGKLINQKLYRYDGKQHIQDIETHDGTGRLLIAKRFACDIHGNPLRETIEGDFGIFSIQRTFSENRLIREEQSDGLGYEYTYLGSTRLVTSKTTLCEGKPLRKIEYLYDEANNLIEEIEVGKTITKYTLYQQGQHLHRPEWKEKRDWEGRLTHKVRWTYDRFGNLAREDHYGSDGNFAYCIQRTYDSRGNLLEEVNPLGQKASYQYDSRGRQIQEIPFSQNKTIRRAFDAKGRLTILQEGERTTRFAYNPFDELIQKINYLGLETNYRYHPVHGKPVWIEEEPTLLEITYDNFGREVERKDAYGATTFTQPNSYGDPLAIVHPDGGKELFGYAPNRTLLTATDPDGLTTSYTYDPLKRKLSQDVAGHVTTYVYDAYHLLEEKDPLGIATHYTYNLAGQKIEETRGDRTIRFTYDALGFLSRKESASRWTSYQNDVLGRVVTKSIDGYLDTSYTYDAAGNIASISQPHTTHFLYDPYDRLIEKIDPTGAKTAISYTEGDQLLTQKIKDPNGHERTEIYNAHGLLLKKEIPGSALEEFSYDRALRLISQDHLTFTYTPEGFRSSMTEAEKRTTYWTYTPAGKIQSKRKPDGTIIPYEYNAQGKLTRVGSREFQYDALGRLIQGSGFKRAFDPFGNILKEEFATGLTLISSYDDWNRPIERTLPDGSRIHYKYEGPFLREILRKGVYHGYFGNSEYEYAHSYNQYNAKGLLLEETGAFTSQYSYDKEGRCIHQQNPYFEEQLTYDPAGNLIQKGKDSYAYDAADQLLSSTGHFTFSYDSHYNRTGKNHTTLPINDINQIQSLPYDANGNLTFSGFLFDEFDQLIQTKQEKITYDALGRRLQKGTRTYLYFGDEEVGVFEENKPKELKIPGLSAPIALEIDNQPYFPITDVQGTIRKLVDPKTLKVCRENNCDPFGDGLTATIPYAYAGKRYDPETGLIYFGKRYYVPSLGRWLTPDPLGPLDHSNLYQYVFNNPYRFQDPNGESIGGYLLGLGEIILGGTLIITGGVLEIVTLGGYTIGCGFQVGAGMSLIGDGLIRTAYHAQDIKVPNAFWKNTNVYAPDRLLPNTPDGVHIPDTDAPHTQLGTQEGRKGKYPQAREFDKKGNPVRDIDFTDHGRPQNHPNPHQHDHIPNSTGGTPERSRIPKPVSGWKY